MSGDGYRVDPEALERITKGINQAMSELKELGFDIEANLGRGFDDLELADLEVGDSGLRETFADFCDRWGWGVRALMQDANEFAGRLNLSAGLYHEQEEYASNTLKTVWTAAAGNPYLSKEEVEERSWSDTLKDNRSPTSGTRTTARSPSWRGRTMPGRRGDRPGRTSRPRR